MGPGEQPAAALAVVEQQRIIRRAPARAPLPCAVALPQALGGEQRRRSSRRLGSAGAALRPRAAAGSRASPGIARPRGSATAGARTRSPARRSRARDCCAVVLAPAPARGSNRPRKTPLGPTFIVRPCARPSGSIGSSSGRPACSIQACAPKLRCGAHADDQLVSR